ncbi:acyltransferase [Companilactobacillus metriopterae]|uniref:acyltransferase n=1 Tax=Companilactobacillus metriopterae TaxID=1909267 RepID=UPI00100B4BA9|nr:acyltransferase [Companilactobacillus metriopterae]
MEEKQSRIFYLDFIRVIAILLVVFIHVSAIDTVQNIGSHTWVTIKLLNYFAHISVPLFFMISGALLLNSKRTLSLSYTWKKRIPHILIPFLVWSLASPIIGGIHAKDLNWSIVWDSFRLVFGHPTQITYWFMYPLIGIYILSPVIKALVDNTDKKMLNYILIVWFITNSVLPTMFALLPKQYRHLIEVYPAANFFLIGGYVGYFILGYYLTKIDLNRFNNWILFIVGILFVLIGCYTEYKNPKLLDIYNASYVTEMFIPLMSVPFFMLLQKWGNRIDSDGVKNVFARLSPLVFGVYLIHNLIILYIEPVMMASVTGLIGTFSRYIVVLAISIISIWVLSYIPIINYLFTGVTRYTKKAK